MIRVGWYTYLAPRQPATWRVRNHASAIIRMRYWHVAAWINRHCPDIHSSLYDPAQTYDVVVFLKMMNPQAQAAFAAAAAKGARTIFDFNVNFIEEWGEFPIEKTRPEQYHKDEAAWMLTHADHVVADSTVLGEIAGRLADEVTVITDNVNLDRFRRVKHHRPGPLTLVWSGIAQKGYHLRALLDVLPHTPDVRFLLLSDRPPPVMDALRPFARVRYRRFRVWRFAQDLRGGDVIISPRAVVNSYSVGHTEYKITTGMALGLPAIAHPQQSYQEALAGGGGIIAESPDDWIAALEQLRDPAARQQMGQLARQTVMQRYSTAVIAQQYADVIRGVAQRAHP